jgi:hypothetical protein
MRSAIPVLTTGYCWRDRYHDRAFLAHPNILSDKNPTWVAIPLGEQFPTTACNPAGSAVFVICEGAIQELRLNTSTLRFQYTYRAGYIDATPDTD